MKNRNIILLTLVFGLCSVLYSTRFGGNNNALFTNLAALFPPFLATCYGFYAYRTYQHKSAHGRALLYISMAMLLWFMGELAFFWFQFIVDINPYPSIADISFLAGYPLLLAGLLTEIKANKSTFKNTNQFIQLLIAIIMIMLGLAVLYFGVILAYAGSEPLLNNLVAMAYGVGGLILIAPTLFVLKIAVDYRGGKLFTSWGLILIALLLKLYGDVFFAVYRNAYTALEWPFNMIDLVWVTSYLLLAYSFFNTAITVKQVQSRLK